MPTLDRRTKRPSEVRPVSIAGLVHELGPSIPEEHRARAARAQELLGLPPLTLVVDGDACTFDRGSIAADAADGAIVAVLDPDALTDLVAGVRSTMVLTFGPGAELPHGGHVRFHAWEYVLRALFDGRALHEGGALAFRARDGDPLDLRRAFTPDDDDADIAHFLTEAGYLHLRGWVDPTLLPRIEDEVAAAAAAAARDQPYRWWARLESGVERCVRVMYVLEVSPTMAALVEAEPYQRLSRLFPDGHRRFPERPQSSEALIKPVGVVEGVADVPLHRDCSFGGCDYNCAGYAVGLPLSATGPEAGHLHVVAGSHRVAMPPPGSVPGYDAGLPLVAVHTEPGDLTIHVSCTLHGTEPPRTQDRTVVYTTFSLPPLPGEAARQVAAAPMPDPERLRSAPA